MASCSTIPSLLQSYLIAWYSSRTPAPPPPGPLLLFLPQVMQEAKDQSGLKGRSAFSSYSLRCLVKANARSKADAGPGASVAWQCWHSHWLSFGCGFSDDGMHAPVPGFDSARGMNLWGSHIDMSSNRRPRERGAAWLIFL